MIVICSNFLRSWGSNTFPLEIYSYVLRTSTAGSQKEVSYLNICKGYITAFRILVSAINNSQILPREGSDRNHIL